ncbi:hypothetical protein [Virgibacillus pantothenticus]|nr:hypothetical protein [Virgibacillus pantothenticus]
MRLNLGLFHYHKDNPHHFHSDAYGMENNVIQTAEEIEKEIT